jgi:hypothetical protein
MICTSLFVLALKLDEGVVIIVGIKFIILSSLIIEFVKNGFKLLLTTNISLPYHF